MNARKMIPVVAAAVVTLYAPLTLAQDPTAPIPAPAPSQISSIATGFMTEGLLSATVFTTADGMSFFNAASVPAAVIGFRMPKLAIGLGIGFYRGTSIVKDEPSDSKIRDSFTSMIFSPRVEISLFQSIRAAAEAYLVLSVGVGFNVSKQKAETPMGESQDTDSGVALGTHIGLGGRCFFGGGPFALGMEFGYSGLFLNLKDNEDEESYWTNIHGAYGALVGTFIFG